MKATKGTQITCIGTGCTTVAGVFIKDVEDDSPITTNDVDMDGGAAIPSHQDGGRKWSCLKCQAPVAELAGDPTRWKVHTARGWVS
jgi:hypothetical protein